MEFSKFLKNISKVNVDKSCWVHSWENCVDKNKPHLIISKNSRLVSAITKQLKDGIFYLYKFPTDFLKNRSNVCHIFSPTSFEHYFPLGTPSLGFFILDTNSKIEAKNILQLFHQYINENTVFFCPNLVNFEGFADKTLAGLMEFCEKYNYKINWLAHRGHIKEYDFGESLLDSGVTFSLSKK